MGGGGGDSHNSEVVRQTDHCKFINALAQLRKFPKRFLSQKNTLETKTSDENVFVGSFGYAGEGGGDDFGNHC